MTHPLGSPFVRDQLSPRVVLLNERRVQPKGHYVLYWMRSTQRFEDNWALRMATLEADRIGKPLLIYHELSPRRAYASTRFHTFAMQGAQELAARALHLGLTYRFALPHRVEGADRYLACLTARAALVVTDYLPTTEAIAGAALVAGRAPCQALAVDSFGVVPFGIFHKAEYAARTIRPRHVAHLALSLEPVADRPPRCGVPASLLDSLEVQWLDVRGCDISAEVARCDVDHDVAAVPLRGGLVSARARLATFLSDGLRDYSTRRRNPSDVEGTSRLSPYLSHGMISPLEIVRDVLATDAGAHRDAFLDELLTWRELALNFCARDPAHDSLSAVPDWAHRSMAAHAADKREVIYSLDVLERAATHDPLWNAGQRELVETGQMHGVVRLLWGKSVLRWATRYEDAFAWLQHLNDKYSLDGRDPTGIASIQWCFGKFDRPFVARPVWGAIRPMSLERALSKYDARSYVTRWGAHGATAAPLVARRPDARANNCASVMRQSCRAIAALVPLDTRGGAPATVS